MNPPAKFGRLARLYRWMEYASFGSYLKQCRELRMGEFTSDTRTLVYGDGDGRFLEALTRQQPAMRLVAIDASAEMLREASRRLSSDANVRLICADALHFEAAALPEAPFDLVISHFFLDCFCDREIALLLKRVDAATRKGTVWVISDFARPRGRLAGWIGSVIVLGLYGAFGLLTGLRTRRLPDHAAAMRRDGWLLEDEQNLLGELLTSQRWRRGPES